MVAEIYAREGRKSLYIFGAPGVIGSTTAKFKYNEENLGTYYPEYGKPIENVEKIYDIDHMAEEVTLDIEPAYQEYVSEGEPPCNKGSFYVQQTPVGSLQYEIVDTNTEKCLYFICLSEPMAISCVEPLHRQELDRILQDFYENVSTMAFRVKGFPLEVTVYDSDKVSFVGPVQYFSYSELDNWLKLERLIRDGGKEGLVMQFTRAGTSENGKPLLYVDAQNSNNFVTFEQPIEVNLSEKEVNALVGRWVDVSLVGHNKDGSLSNVFEEYGSKMVASDRKHEEILSEWTAYETAGKYKEFRNFIFKILGIRCIDYMLGLGFGKYIGYEYVSPQPDDEDAHPIIRQCPLPNDPIGPGEYYWPYDEELAEEKFQREMDEFDDAKEKEEADRLFEERAAEWEEQSRKETIQEDLREDNELDMEMLEIFTVDDEFDPI